MGERDKHANFLLRKSAELGATLDLDNMFDKEPADNLADTLPSIKSNEQSSPEKINTILHKLCRRSSDVHFDSKESYRSILMTFLRTQYVLNSITDKLSSLAVQTSNVTTVDFPSYGTEIASNGIISHNKKLIMSGYDVIYRDTPILSNIKPIIGNVTSSDIGSGYFTTTLSSTIQTRLAGSVSITTHKPINYLEIELINPDVSVSISDSTGHPIEFVKSGYHIFCLNILDAGTYSMTIQCSPTKMRNEYVGIIGIKNIKTSMVKYDKTNSFDFWILNNNSGIYASSITILNEGVVSNNNNSILINIHLPDIVDEDIVALPNQTIKLYHNIGYEPTITLDTDIYNSKYNVNTFSNKQDIYRHQWSLPADYPTGYPAIEFTKIIPSSGRCLTTHMQSETAVDFDPTSIDWSDDSIESRSLFGHIRQEFKSDDKLFGDAVLFYIHSPSEEYISSNIIVTNCSCNVYINDELTSSASCNDTTIPMSIAARMKKDTMNKVIIMTSYNSTTPGTSEVDISDFIKIFTDDDKYIVSSQPDFIKPIPFYEFIINTYQDSTKYCGYKITDDRKLQLFFRPDSLIATKLRIAYYKHPIKTATINIVMDKTSKDIGYDDQLSNNTGLLLSNNKFIFNW